MVPNCAKINDDLLSRSKKNATAMQYITCLLPTQRLQRYPSGTPSTIISSYISQPL